MYRIRKPRASHPPQLPRRLRSRSSPRRMQPFARRTASRPSLQVVSSSSVSTRASPRFESAAKSRNPLRPNTRRRCTPSPRHAFIAHAARKPQPRGKFQTREQYLSFGQGDTFHCSDGGHSTKTPRCKNHPTLAARRIFQCVYFPLPRVFSRSLATSPSAPSMTNVSKISRALSARSALRVQ